mmetsp:Transcript_844/g.2299  ORF Transcript_844/g.2299 Transcript_844/m.2299 type:complete len:214 (-) Transcript_844:1006-1647(-)
MHVARHDAVLGVQVQVHHAVSVHVLHRLRQLVVHARQVLRVPEITLARGHQLGHGAARPRCQRAALSPLSDDVDVEVVLEGVPARHARRRAAHAVLRAGEKPARRDTRHGFHLLVRHIAIGLERRLVQHLERHVAAQLAVERPRQAQHHAAAAKLRLGTHIRQRATFGQGRQHRHRRAASQVELRAGADGHVHREATRMVRHRCHRDRHLQWK